MSSSYGVLAALAFAVVSAACEGQPPGLESIVPGPPSLSPSGPDTGSSGGPSTVSPALVPPVENSGPETKWLLVAKVTSTSGPGQTCLSGPAMVEEHTAYMRVTADRISIVVVNNGWQQVPEEFEGTIVGRDFTATAPSSIAYSEPAKCPDGTLLHSGPKVDLTGRLSENGRELTALMHERWGVSLDRLETTRTWSWTAVQP